MVMLDKFWQSGFQLALQELCGIPVFIGNWSGNVGEYWVLCVLLSGTAFKAS